MLTPTIQIQTASFSEVVQMLERANCRVEFRDDTPLEFEGRRWQRFTCQRGPHSVAGCMIEPSRGSPGFTVAISLDLRRLLWLWRIPGDQRLAWDLRDALLAAEGVPIQDDD